MHLFDQSCVLDGRLCGAFFREWLDPLSRTFQEKALEASIAAVHKASQQDGTAKAAAVARKARVSGAVAAAFQLQLRTGGGAGGAAAGTPRTNVREQVGETDGDAATQAAAFGAGGGDGGDDHAKADDGEGATPQVQAPAPAGAAQAHPGSTPKVKKRQETPAASRRARERQQQQQKQGAAGKCPLQGIALLQQQRQEIHEETQQQQSIKSPARVKKEPAVAVPTAEQLALRTPIAKLNGATITAAVAHLQKCDGRLAGVIAAIGHPTGLLHQMAEL
jgi:hypothetical protein